jgi:hypothetical protein
MNGMESGKEWNALEKTIGEYLDTDSNVSWHEMQTGFNLVKPVFFIAHYPGRVVTECTR